MVVALRNAERVIAAAEDFADPESVETAHFLRQWVPYHAPLLIIAFRIRTYLFLDVLLLLHRSFLLNSSGR